MAIWRHSASNTSRALSSPAVMRFSTSRRSFVPRWATRPPRPQVIFWTSARVYLPLKQRDTSPPTGRLPEV